MADDVEFEKTQAEYVFNGFGGWYFYDETWNPVGPYETEEEAYVALYKYEKGL